MRNLGPGYTAAAVGALALLCVGAVHAQPAWPVKPVRLVLPQTTGGKS